MYVVCTAGHVDHGKSSLVHALTAMQPDRFAEEQRRGLTIDLGFAWFDLDDRHTVAFVDLPGHERFIGNMLAGAGPVEIALLVVAANEGWMPQSREHLQILDLLGVRHGVVALTKIDTVDADLVELAELEVLEALERTTLATAPIVRTSARTGVGLAALRTALGNACDRAGTATDRNRPRVWIDRSFTIRGAGTVVTGTLGGGSLTVGDDLAVLPGGARGRARSLQSLDTDRTTVPPGSRVAVNIAGVGRDEAARGDVLVRAHQWRSTHAVDGWVRVLDGQRLSHRGAWHVHIGSAEHVSQVWPLGRRAIVGPDQGPVRIELRGPCVVEAGDRFVLREVGRGATVGGGPILDPAPPRRPRGEAARRQRVAQLEARAEAIDDRERLLALHTAERGAAGIGEAHALLGVAPTAAPDGLAVLGDHYVSVGHLRRWAEAIGDALEDHHRAHPLARTAPRRVVAQVALEHGCPDAAIDDVVDWCARQGVVVREPTGVRLPDHTVTLDAEQKAARDALLAALDATPFTPPALSDAAERAGVSPALLGEMESAGQLVRLTGDIAMTTPAIERATTLLREAEQQLGPLTASQARQVLGSSRKYVLPLLEELDRRGITRRRGDTRTVADAR